MKKIFKIIIVIVCWLFAMILFGVINQNFIQSQFVGTTFGIFSGLLCGYIISKIEDD